MSQELATSLSARTRILTNSHTLKELEDRLSLSGVRHASELVFTKDQVAKELHIDARTIDRYIAKHGEELQNHGYRVIKGQELKEIRKAFASVQSPIIISPKTPSLGIFSFRAFLNLVMLVVESARAKEIRSQILDIAIGVVAHSQGGYADFTSQEHNNTQDDTVKQLIVKSSQSDFNEFIQTQGAFLKKQIQESETLDVFKRLKDR